MILNRTGAEFEYEGVTYTIGGAIVGTAESEYAGLYGRCCFSERMRKLFRKNEKNVLRFCNKKAKEKRRLQRVKKPM